MKPPPPMLGTLQFHLPLLLNVPASVIPPDKHAELVLALVELLVGGAHALEEPIRDGGDDDRETDR